MVDGSNAAGSTASALQATTAATVAQPSALPVAAVQSAAPASASVPQVTAVPVIAAATLADGSDHARSGAGDTGSNPNSTGDGAAALQQLTTTATSASDGATPVPTLRVHADVDSSDFPQSLTDRASYMLDNGWSSAKLQVNPPQLGPIELQIAVQGAHAQVTMTTHSAVTREALESSAPKLREMLNAQGFSQVNVDVSQRSFQERTSYTPPYESLSSVSSVAAPAAATGGAARASLGALDAYA